MNRSDFLKRRGEAYHSEMVFEKAIHSLSEAIALTPKSPELYCSRAKAYVGQVWQKAGDPPDDPEQFAKFDRKVQKSRELVLALQDLNKAIELNEGFVEAHYGRGLVYFDQGNYRAAITAFQRTLKIQPDDEGAPYWMAQAMDALDRPNDSV